jgi:hypothetical protein
VAYLTWLDSFCKRVDVEGTNVPATIKAHAGYRSKYAYLGISIGGLYKLGLVCYNLIGVIGADTSVRWLLVRSLFHGEIGFVANSQQGAHMFERQSDFPSMAPEMFTRMVTECCKSPAAKVAEKRRTLRDALNVFNTELADVSPTTRDAILNRLYERVIRTVFEFHVTLAKDKAQQQIQDAKTSKGRRAALRQFRATADRLYDLYRAD